MTCEITVNEKIERHFCMWQNVTCATRIILKQCHSSKTPHPPLPPLKYMPHQGPERVFIDLHVFVHPACFVDLKVKIKNIIMIIYTW